MNAAIQEACNSAATLGISAELALDYKSAWSRTGVDRQGAIGAVQGCVLAQQEAAAAAAVPVNVDEIIKNPDAVKGQVFFMVVEISQYDAATGACTFRGYWDSSDHTYSFDYAGDNAYFTSGDGISDCPNLSGIDQDDVIRVWGESTGSLSYETTLGGNITVPSFKILKVELIRKA